MQKIKARRANDPYFDNLVNLIWDTSTAFSPIRQITRYQANVAADRILTDFGHLSIDDMENCFDAVIFKKEPPNHIDTRVVYDWVKAYNEELEAEKKRLDDEEKERLRKEQELIDGYPLDLFRFCWDATTHEDAVILHKYTGATNIIRTMYLFYNWIKDNEEVNKLRWMKFSFAEKFAIVIKNFKRFCDDECFRYKPVMTNVVDVNYYQHDGRKGIQMAQYEPETCFYGLYLGSPLRPDCDYVWDCETRQWTNDPQRVSCNNERVRHLDPTRPADDKSHLYGSTGCP